ncbi:glutamate racemase [Carboxylicivirga marina]|uniref:glutamate racemase n=1 Tax=Carboxylicivirga marina TaxID=2800988 RepID=UPI0025962084|nr:glutamate racemase [uncultured Carboxylicivirga sp.]
MKETGPIAVFDSGYGGLTVLNKIRQHLPQYDYIYLGDNARTPYGTRSFEVVYEYTLEAVKKLFDMGAHLVILACNTASAKALRNIQQKDLPSIDPDKRVLGVIRPSVEVVDKLSNSKHVGVLGTVGTIQSKSYSMEINKLFPEIKVSQEACPMWVPLVENNEFKNNGADYFVKQSIDGILDQDTNIDTIILGCTHYPLLIDKIRKYLPTGVNIIEQGDIVGESLKDYLRRHPEMEQNCSKNGSVSFYTTEQVSKFKQTAGIFFEGQLNVEHMVL